MSNLRDFVGTVKNQPNITKIVKHDPPKTVKTDGKAKEGK